MFQGDSGGRGPRGQTGPPGERVSLQCYCSLHTDICSLFNLYVKLFSIMAILGIISFLFLYLKYWRQEVKYSNVQHLSLEGGMQSPKFCVKYFTVMVIMLSVSLYVSPFFVASSRL